MLQNNPQIKSLIDSQYITNCERTAFAIKLDTIGLAKGVEELKGLVE